MMIPDEWLYEYSVIRYVPRVDREEFLNIGLIMMNKRKKWLKGKVLLNEPRLRALYPNLDYASLKNQSRLFEREDVPDKDLPVEEKYRWLSAVKSACLQVSPSHPGIATGMGTGEEKGADWIMTKEFNRLFSQLVEM